MGCSYSRPYVSRAGISTPSAREDHERNPQSIASLTAAHGAAEAPKRGARKIHSESERQNRRGSRELAESKCESRTVTTMNTKQSQAHARREKLHGLAGDMPPLSHYPDRDQPFDPACSDVLRWIADRPELVQVIFNKMKDCGAIIFDPDTRTWRGCHFDHHDS